MYKGYYNKKTGDYLGFYREDIHDSIPSPTIDLTKEEWQLALTGDYRVVKGKNTKYERPGPTVEFKLARMRKERDILLAASDWTQFNDSPLSAEKKQQWVVYRQQLRDIVVVSNLGKSFPPTP